jgi:hypothetical protein
MVASNQILSGATQGNGSRNHGHKPTTTKGGYSGTQIYRQKGYLISELLFFQNKKS